MFNKETCNKIRSMLCSNDTNLNRHSLTMALSAFIWSRVKLAREINGNQIPCEAYQAVNIRSKVHTLSESYYYFGNMVVNALAKLSNKHDESALCNSFMETMENSIEKIIHEKGFIEGLQNGKEDLGFMAEHFERASRGEIMTFGFSSLRSLPIYEADFGWGKPIWVTSATLVLNDIAIMIPGGASSEDTYVYVNLRPPQMANLEADQLFLSFVSNKSANFVTSKM
ncbi:hypothetical protein RND81_06G005500 [Saponaria officinalis]|uniref:Uncharacterized protein n=1 Tax=Saponaria officinalis TaxID=3572 RepID=A0AAW1K501_SAPOF